MPVRRRDPGLELIVLAAVGPVDGPAGHVRSPIVSRFVADRAPSLDDEPSIGPTLVRAPLDSFVGRLHELDALLDRLSDTRCRIVSVTGSVGAGRRRLVAEALARCRVPAMVLDARTRIIGESVAEHVARSIGVPPERVAGVLGGGPVVLGFTDVDASKVTTADAAWLMDLLAIVPTVTVVVTAVSPLEVPGEWVVEVGPLAVDEAAELLVDRAAAWSATFARDADSGDEQIRAVVALGGGSPLATEHLARRVAVHGAASVLDEIRAGTHAMPSVIVRSTVDGWQRLPAAPRDLMAVLSVTRAAVDLADLGRLAGRRDHAGGDHTVGDHTVGDHTVGDHDERADTIDDAVSVLVRRHLVDVVPSRRVRRFRAAATAAAAVRDALDPDERHRVEERHAVWVLRSMTDASDRLLGPDRRAATRRLVALAADVEPALDHLESAGRGVEVVRLLAAVVPTVAVTIGRDRAIDQLEGCLRSGDPSSLPVEVRARAHAALAAGLGHTSRVVDAHRIRAHVEATVALTADVEHLDARWALAMAFSAFPSVNDPDYLVELAELGRRRSAEVRDEWMVARFTSYLAAAVHQTGDVERAITLAVDAAARAESLDDDHLRLRSSMVLAGLPPAESAERPRPVHHDVVALAERDGDPMTTAIVTVGSVVRAALGGDAVRTARGVVRVFEVSRSSGVMPTEVLAMVLAAQVFALDGDDVRAARAHGATLRYRDVVTAISPRWWVAANEAWAQGLAGRLGDESMVREVERGAAVPWTSAVLDTLADVRRVAERGGDPTRGVVTADLRFTPRERQVLDLLVLGWTDKQIAQHLGIKPKTVARHDEHLFRKLGVRSRAAAVAAAYELGLVPSSTPPNPSNPSNPSPESPPPGSSPRSRAEPTA